MVALIRLTSSSNYLPLHPLRMGELFFVFNAFPFLTILSAVERLLGRCINNCALVCFLFLFGFPEEPENVQNKLVKTDLVSLITKIVFVPSSSLSVKR